MIVAISEGISRGNGWQWQCPVSALTAGHSGVSTAHARSSDSGGGAGLPGHWAVSQWPEVLGCRHCSVVSEDTAVLQ